MLLVCSREADTVTKGQNNRLSADEAEERGFFWSIRVNPRDPRKSLGLVRVFFGKQDGERMFRLMRRLISSELPSEATACQFVESHGSQLGDISIYGFAA